MLDSIARNACCNSGPNRNKTGAWQGRGAGSRLQRLRGAGPDRRGAAHDALVASWRVSRAVVGGARRREGLRLAVGPQSEAVAVQWVCTGWDSGVRGWGQAGQAETSGEAVCPFIHLVHSWCPRARCGGHMRSVPQPLAVCPHTIRPHPLKIKLSPPAVKGGRYGSDGRRKNRLTLVELHAHDGEEPHEEEAGGADVRQHGQRPKHCGGAGLQCRRDRAWRTRREVQPRLIRCRPPHAVEEQARPPTRCCHRRPARQHGSGGAGRSARSGSSSGAHLHAREEGEGAEAEQEAQGAGRSGAAAHARQEGDPGGGHHNQVQLVPPVPQEWRRGHAPPAPGPGQNPPGGAATGGGCRRHRRQRCIPWRRAGAAAGAPRRAAAPLGCCRPYFNLRSCLRGAWLICRLAPALLRLRRIQRRLPRQPHCQPWSGRLL